MTSLDKGQIQDSLLKFLAGEGMLNLKDANHQSKLFSTGLLSSLDMIEITLLIEEKFAIHLDPLDINLDNLDTVEKIAEFVMENSAQPQD